MVRRAVPLVRLRDLARPLPVDLDGMGLMDGKYSSLESRVPSDLRRLVLVLLLALDLGLCLVFDLAHVLPFVASFPVTV